MGNPTANIFVICNCS